MPKFNPAKENQSLNVVRGWIRKMKRGVEGFIDPTNPSAVTKGGHYIRMLDQQILACDETERMIDMLDQPFPNKTFNEKDFSGLA